MMNASDDDLSEALHRADAKAPPPLQPGLADRVRTRARRQRRTRRIAAGSVVAIAAIGLTLVGLARHDKGALPPTVVATQPELRPDAPEDLAAEVKLASREAELRLEVAQRLVAAERRHRQSARVAEVAPTRLEAIAKERQQAALTLVDHADRLESRVGRPLGALDAYRRAVELFPETPAAQVARRRIEQLQSQNRT